MVLVGGTGFIGQAICRSACEVGLRVLSVASDGFPYVSPLLETTELFWLRNVDWVRADVADRDADPQAIMQDGARTVVYLAAHRRGSRSRMDLVNHQAAISWAHAASKVGASKFVYLSCASAPTPHLYTSAFMRSKHAAEAALLGPQAPLPAAVLQLGYVFGLGRTLAFPAGLAMHVAWRAGVGAPLFHAHPFLQALHVDTVARSSLRAALDDRVVGALGPDDIQSLAMSSSQEWVGDWLRLQRTAQRDAAAAATAAAAAAASAGIAAASSLGHAGLARTGAPGGVALSSAGEQERARRRAAHALWHARPDAEAQ